MKTIITQSEKMQLLGLLTLARSHQKITNECDSEMSKIVGDEDGYNHLSDAIYDDTKLDDALKNMKIKVKGE